MRWQPSATPQRLQPVCAPEEAIVKIVENVQPPTGINRVLFWAPIYLYRVGLGWLFGGQRLPFVRLVPRQ
jgi:hypothetical protein